MSVWQVQIYETTIKSITAGNIFQDKIDEIFKFPNVFGIVDDILIVSYDADGRDHNRALRWVMQIYHKENLKLNKNKCHFMHPRIPFFGETVFRHVVLPDHHKAYVLADMLLFIIKKNFISRYHELLRKIVTSHSRGVWAAKKTDISKIRMDMEQNIT